MNRIKIFLSNYWSVFSILLFAVVVMCYLDKHSPGIIALSALLTALFGSKWFDTSDKKMRGRLDYDIARKYLKSVLKLRDAIKIVRNPFIPVGEMENALKENGLSINELNDKNAVNRSVYSLRWKNVQDAWTNFEEILTEAEISWKDEPVKAQKDLDILIRELRSVIWLFVNYPDDFRKELEQKSRMLYGTHDESDEFAKKINEEIEKIRNFLKKYL